MYETCCVQLYNSSSNVEAALVTFLLRYLNTTDSWRENCCCTYMDGPVRAAAVLPVRSSSLTSRYARRRVLTIRLQYTSYSRIVLVTLLVFMGRVSR